MRDIRAGEKSGGPPLALWERRLFAFFSEILFSQPARGMLEKNKGAVFLFPRAVVGKQLRIIEENQPHPHPP